MDDRKNGVPAVYAVCYC